MGENREAEGIEIAKLNLQARQLLPHDRKTRPVYLVQDFSQRARLP